MLEVIDFSSWNVYDGAAEGSGRSEKIWLKSDDGKIGLFKYPKVNPSNNKETTEHISEHLAHKIGDVVGVPTANVDIGKYDGRIGSMSYFVCEENEFLREGIWFISAKFPRYNAEKMIDEENGQYYCLNHLLESVPNILSIRNWIEMMLFDFLIGNSDRHQSNWALLIKLEKKLSLRIKWCPLYDNGSSLCCYVKDEDVEQLLGNDKNRFESFTDSKSKSLIRLNGDEKHLPTHREVIKFLFEKHSVSKEIAKRFINSLTTKKIEELLSEYQDNILSEQKKKLIYRLLCKKCEILEHLLKEVEYSESIE